MDQQSEKIRIVTVLGSFKPGNNTSQALNIVIDQLKNQEKVMVDAIDPSQMKLPFPGSPDENSDSQKLREVVSGATGVVLATPEYHGSYSSLIKLVIENLGFPSVLAAKPVVLLGVASGQIGAIKALEHLRSVCSHIGAFVLPSVVSVAEVDKIFDEKGKCLDARIEKRLRGLGTALIQYIRQNICPRMALEAMVRGKDI